MAKNYAAIAKDVLRLVGGEQNVTHFEHCSTRLRFSIAEESKVDRAGLKAVPGVMGYEILYNGASLAHNISEGGASLAVAVKTKNPDLRSTAISTGVSAIFGITEPAIYSITLQNKRVLYGVMAGSFVSGSFIGLMAVKAFVAMGPGLAGMAMFVDPENAMNVVWAFAGFGIALGRPACD